MKLPPGYTGSRQVALKFLSGLRPGRGALSVEPPVADPDLPPAVTAQVALGDLPPITLHLEGKLQRGARRLQDLIRYDRKPASTYGKLMRTWPAYAKCRRCSGTMLFAICRGTGSCSPGLNPGDQYPEAHRHAVTMFNEELARLAKKGRAPAEGSDAWNDLWDAFVPPYDVGKFPNKWRKMEPDLPARTLMAHLGKDGYSHIHYDSDQARTISVREAARLQSFPDGFTFCGTMNPAFRQIGNAVPPLLARAVARADDESPPDTSTPG